jgi:hypothetical protein
LHDVRLLQELTQEPGEVIGHHVGQLLGIGQLDQFKQRREVGAGLLAALARAGNVASVSAKGIGFIRLEVTQS